MRANTKIFEALFYPLTAVITVIHSQDITEQFKLGPRTQIAQLTRDALCSMTGVGYGMTSLAEAFRERATAQRQALDDLDHLFFEVHEMLATAWDSFAGVHEYGGRWVIAAIHTELETTEKSNVPTTQS